MQKIGPTCRDHISILAVLLCAVTLAVGFLTMAVTPAEAAPAPVDLVVTSPPDPVTVSPGTTATASLTVGNLGHTSFDVQITTHAVALNNNGKTTFEAGPDPRFAGRIAISPSSLTLPARSERTVHISVAIPRGLAPDDYFLGFLVSPVVNSPSVAVQNDVGGLVVLELPGARSLGLTASFQHLGGLSLSLSSSASGILQVTSTGRSTVGFTTTVTMDGHPKTQPNYIEMNTQLLPPGLSRDIPVRVSSWLGIGWYTIHAMLVYDTPGATSRQVTVEQTVFVLNPLWFLILPAGIVAVISWRRHRRRPRRKKGLHSAGRQRAGQLRSEQREGTGRELEPVG